MGSVGSLISNRSLSNKHCQASEYKHRKGLPQKKAGRGLEGLLKYGFSQGSSGSGLPPKGLAHSKSGRSEDFFYIKVSHKPRPSHLRGGAADGRVGGGIVDMEPDKGLPPKLPSGKPAERSTALIRPTAFKAVLPRSTPSSDTHKSLDHILSPLDRARTGDLQERRKQDTFSGTLSDSGRNSMSSLPTLSTSGSLSASAGPQSSSAQSHGPLPHIPPWTNEISLCSRTTGLTSGGLLPKANDEVDSVSSPDRSSFRSDDTRGGVRSPLTTDEFLIEQLEQRLLERETELQELQVSFEEKESDTCHLFEGRQRYCAEEMEDLKQRCSSRLRQVSQRATQTQHALQQQVSQLQAEKERLEEDLSRLAHEKDSAQVRLRSYEMENTQLTPTLEETQWEVCQKTGEISLLKQQLRDCHADVGHKLNEIVSLKATLKETRAQMEALVKQSKEDQDKIHTRTVDVEVCQNELQRKKNEAHLLREKVGKLEEDIQAMKQDLVRAKEQRQQQSMKRQAQAQAQVRLGQASSPVHGQTEENRSPTTKEPLQKEVERLKGQLREEREAQKRLAHSFEKERQTWNKEKSRVIKYQKQLQTNYLQMHKKNQDLERILQELTAEMEGRPEQEMELCSSGLTYEDILATEI